MKNPSFEHKLDAMIFEILEQKRLKAKLLRVVITGSDMRSLERTFACIDALYHRGYAIAISFSYSAFNSMLAQVCQRWIEVKKLNITTDNCGPHLPKDDYYGVFFPALSMNSLAKMAQCLNDNIACEWAFDALACQRPVYVTLSFGEDESHFSSTMRQCLADYIKALKGLGVQVLPQACQAVHNRRQLITVADVRKMQKLTSLSVEADALITPAARDEINRLQLVLNRKS